MKTMRTCYDNQMEILDLRNRITEIQNSKGNFKWQIRLSIKES
jgi:hypothetical protein